MIKIITNDDNIWTSSVQATSIMMWQWMTSASSNTWSVLSKKRYVSILPYTGLAAQPQKTVLSVSIACDKVYGTAHLMNEWMNEQTNDVYTINMLFSLFVTVSSTYVPHDRCDARHMVTFPAYAGTKLYCLVTEAHVCKAYGGVA